MTTPTPDEAAALADAETYTRAMAERRKHHGALAAFVAEYDRRAEEIAALHAEVERLRGIEQRATAVVVAWRTLRPYRPEMAAMLVRPLDDLARSFPTEIDRLITDMAQDAAERFEAGGES